MSEHKPYTFVTTSIDADGTRLGVSFHTGDLAVTVLETERQRPILTISSAEARVSLSTTGGGPVTDQDVTLARRLADATARYLAMCEHLHAEHATSAGTNAA
ncbi:hypothetical protein HS041_07210 [Planomonospora sp. ID67723]|uniref:hypothetical protein n=1 Tax=Planomonospora sp. ID67723 TaxID=2738134 RepID=UPI0018C42CCA|nr:hypothetical protein [Planomonospora sp. ID67723]MBG0827550.1 hypothetical protein [Planomonospora sp. ID67723]